MAARPLLLVGLTAALTACGGGSDPLSRSEYVARGNAICAAAQRDLAALGERDLPPAQEGPEAVRIGDRQVEDLLALEPPESLRPQRARLEELVDEVARLGRRAADGDDPSRALERITAKGREAEAVLAELGLARCADAT